MYVDVYMFECYSDDRDMPLLQACMCVHVCMHVRVCTQAAHAHSDDRDVLLWEDCMYACMYI